MIETERADERDERRSSHGRSAGESYAETLRQIAPGAEVTHCTPTDGDASLVDEAALAGFDGVFLSGSPLHVYEGAAETERLVEQARRVFRAGVPMFGSCAGLQVATYAAGGRVGPMGPRREAGAVRGIVATEAGRVHPLLAGRPESWDAFSIHDDEVTELPPGAIRLAGNDAARVQAAEIRHGEGVFWGVQYHPELSPAEIATALKKAGDDLTEAGMADDGAQVEAVAELIARLSDPADRAAAWALGVTGEAAQQDRRRLELSNFLDHLVRPRAATREGAGTPA